jgi:Fe-Mn family superoxide dismutase
MEVSTARMLLLGLFVIVVECRFEPGNPENAIHLAPPYYTLTRKADNYILPVLTYGVHLLEPFIDADTAQHHYFGHHEIYRMKMNEALKEWRAEEPDSTFAKEPIMTIMHKLQKVPEKYRTRIRNFGGGYVNHAFYWASMSPNLEDNPVARQPEGNLLMEIEDTWGSYDAFKEEFTKQGTSLFGSGYVWLIRKNTPTGPLAIVTTANQDCPLSDGHFPLMVFDAWEHAYYIKHQYQRSKHMADWWMLVDWFDVAELSDFWKNGMKLSSFYDMPDIAKMDPEERQKMMDNVMEAMSQNSPPVEVDMTDNKSQNEEL